MNDARLSLEYAKLNDNGSVRLTAKLGDDTLAVEKIDILKSKQRDIFVDKLVTLCPRIDRAAVNQECLRIAADISTKAEVSTDSPELDISAIARPELFHAAEVSGILIPVAHRAGGAARGRWELYCRWTDGRRERRELENAIDLPDGDKLWLHPLPAPPEPTMRAAWSAAARRAWLGGAPAPDPAETWKRITERIAWHVDFPPENASGIVANLALWVMFTYLYPVWSSVPYLSIGGPLASGKTTLFRVLARLCFRPIESSNMTAPCLFRTLHERGGALLLDEAERLRDSSPDAGELRSILLSGYKRGSPAMRLEKQGETFRRIEFDCFGPKALACVGSLPEALASRCIRIGMFRSAPESEKPRRRIDADPATWAGIRDDLHALALEHGPTWLDLANRADVVPRSFDGRAYELWQPILALASWLQERGAAGVDGEDRREALRLPDGQRISDRDTAEAELPRRLSLRQRKAAGLIDPAIESAGVPIRAWS
jgi:hypothetical protein